MKLAQPRASADDQERTVHRQTVAAFGITACHVQRHDALVAWLKGAAGTYIFGGLVKSFLNLGIPFNDIDLVAIDTQVMDQLRVRFGFVFREVSKSGKFPSYFMAKSPHHPKMIHLVLLRTHAEAIQFTISGPQYDIDRLMYGGGRFYFCPLIGEKVIRHAIATMRASLVHVPRNLYLYSINREQIQQRHRQKLMSKGFEVID